MLQLTLREAAAKEHTLALLCLNLDNFKSVNNTRGNSVGDAALQETARRVQELCGAAEVLARTGADEFLIAIKGADLTYTQRLADALIQALSAPLGITTTPFRMGLSVGISMYPEHGGSAEELFKNAELAMQDAKASGGGRHLVFRQAMADSVRRRADLGLRLEQALLANRLQLHYQIQVSLQTGKPVGAEALARWYEPDLGWISPSEFIPIAEECGLIQSLGYWAIQEAARQIRAWRSDGLALPGRIAVNVAVLQLREDHFVQQALAIAEEQGVCATDLELELTESAMMSDTPRMLKTTAALVDGGFSLSMDDFGTGYSSLTHLKHFPVEKLKIDMTFIREMLHCKQDEAIVATIIRLGKTLGLRTIAEGVESLEHAAKLREMGCEEAQGFYFGRPVSAHEFAARWMSPS